jgi:hypothetical protein
MEKIFSLILLTVTLVCYGQKSRYKPFKLAIISPDTAVIDESLKSFVDSVQQQHLNTYFASIRRMEDLVNSNDYPRGVMTEKEFKKMQRQTKSSLDNAKKSEDEVRQFKFYKTISEYSASVYQFYFNEYPPFSVFQLINKSELTINSLSHISDSLKADYVVGYKNIHTENKDGVLIIKVKTFLYSKKDDKILFEEETMGDTNSYGDMWTCSNPLSCLLVTAVKSSTDSVFGILRKRQLRD